MQQAAWKITILLDVFCFFRYVEPCLVTWCLDNDACWIGQGVQKCAMLQSSTDYIQPTPYTSSNGQSCSKIQTKGLSGRCWVQNVKEFPQPSVVSVLVSNLLKSLLCAAVWNPIAGVKHNAVIASQMNFLPKSSIYISHFISHAELKYWIDKPAEKYAATALRRRWEMARVLRVWIHNYVLRRSYLLCSRMKRTKCWKLTNNLLPLPRAQVNMTVKSALHWSCSALPDVLKPNTSLILQRTLAGVQSFWGNSQHESSLLFLAHGCPKHYDVWYRLTNLSLRNLFCFPPKRCAKHDSDPGYPIQRW